MGNNLLYTSEELADIKRARDIKELQDIARRLIYRMIMENGNVRMICAPIDVCDGINKKVKLHSLLNYDERQKLLNHNIFSYVPFIKRAAEILGCPFPEALYAMYHPFFYGFIHTGWIEEYYFMPGWEDSPFCQWIVGQARQKRHNRKIIMWLEE